MNTSYGKLWIFLLPLTLIGCGSNTKDFHPPFYTSTQFPLTAPTLPYVSSEVMEIEYPNDLVFEPGTQNAFVLTWTGKVYYVTNFDDVGESSMQSLDISSRISNSIVSGGDRGEEGAFSIVLDPNFNINHYVYISYAGASTIKTVIERFTYDPMTHLIDPDSDETVMTITGNGQRIHKGGHMLFDTNGYLLIATGDGGTFEDEANNAQNLNSLKGKILRIDVSSLPYTSPSTNPFFGQANAQDEIYAYGLRHPWRMTIDPITHRIWAGEVGFQTYEEINLIEKGKNYGWPKYEGATFELRSDVDLDAPHAKPIIDFGREDTDWNCIVGGEFYYGSEFDDLYGKYIFADCNTGAVNAFRYNFENKVVAYNQPISDVPSIVSSIKIHGNDIYFLSFSAGGKIYKLRPSSSNLTFDDVPQKLSDTKLFTNVASLEPASFLQEYEVISPLWSDAADKIRWISLPKGTKIQFNKKDPWIFPVGTTLVKHFEVTTNGETRRLETRVIFRHNENWVGYSYEWNEAQDEAFLNKESRTENLTIGGEEFKWFYPNSQACNNCHTNVSGFVLGVSTVQLNKNSRWKLNDTTYDNQLETWKAAKLFSNDVPPAKDLDALTALDDSTADLQKVIKSYFHSNCSHCHQPDGPTPTNLDMRYKTSLEDMNIVNVDPSRDDFGRSNPKIVKPGDIDNSILWIRLNSTKATRMPALGTKKNYDAMFEKIKSWITQL